MVDEQPRICSGETQTKTPMRFWHTNGSPHLSQTTRPYNNYLKKKWTCKIMCFAVLADHRIKMKECEKKNKHPDFARELKNLQNMNIIIIPIAAFCTITKGLLEGLEDLEIRGRVVNIHNYYIIENGQNIEEIPGDLRRLAVTQTPVIDNQLTLMWKTLKE